MIYQTKIALNLSVFQATILPENIKVALKTAISRKYQIVKE